MKKAFIIAFLLAAPVQAQNDLSATTAKLRKEYPAKITHAQAAELINRVAWIHKDEGWGLLGKTAGNRCPLPNGIEVSCDILIHAPSRHHFDVLSDVENTATPVWRDVGLCIPGPSSGCNMSNFVMPINIGNDTPAPVPTPTPQPDLSDVYNRIKLANDEIATLRNSLNEYYEYAKTLHELVHSQEQTIKTLELKNQLLEDRPYYTGCNASLFGIGLSCRLTK